MSPRYAPMTPSYRAGNPGWPVLLPSALDMTPPAGAPLTERTPNTFAFPTPVSNQRYEDQRQVCQSYQHAQAPPPQLGPLRNDNPNEKTSPLTGNSTVPSPNLSQETVAVHTPDNENSPPQLIRRITNSQVYEQYLQRQKRIPDTRAMVWSHRVEEAFIEGLRLIPRVGRRKITVAGKLRGRNELIADYITRKTGEYRSRKQVSSHIQVLKHLFKNDHEFLDLVSDTADVDPQNENITADTFENFIDELERRREAQNPEEASEAEEELKQEAPRGDQPQPETKTAPLVKPVPEHASLEQKPLVADPQVYGEFDKQIYAPQPVRGTFTASRENSATASGPNPNEWFASVTATPPRRGAGYLGHRRGQSSVDMAGSVVPMAFTLSHNNGKYPHTFTRLMRSHFESPTLPQQYDRIQKRFPYLESMRTRGELAETVPIIHGMVRLDMGSDNVNVRSEAGFLVDAQFLVSNTQPSLLSPAVSGFHRVPTHMWQCVTRVASMGRELLNETDHVQIREELLTGMERLYLPFSSEFWKGFLAGLKSPVGPRKTNPDMAIAELTITQLVYCVPQDGVPELSFVLVYEFERVFDMFSARTVFRRVRRAPVCNALNSSDVPLSTPIPQHPSMVGPTDSAPRALQVNLHPPASRSSTPDKRSIYIPPVPSYPRSMSTVQHSVSQPNASHYGPLSAVENRDFSTLLEESEPIPRCMTAFEAPAPWIDNDLNENWYLFE